MTHRSVAALALAAAVSGCIYPSSPTPVASAGAAASSASASAPGAPVAAGAPGPRVPGTFQLDIGQAHLRQEIDLHGFSCMLAHFPVDATTGYADAVRAAVAQVVERVEPVPAGAASTAARGTGGGVSALPSRFLVRVDSDQEVFGVTFRGQAEIAANVAVDGPGGTATFTVEGRGTAEGRNAMIGNCDTIATVGNQAAQAALADFAAHLRDQLAATPQIRPAPRARRQPVRLPPVRP